MLVAICKAIVCGNLQRTPLFAADESEADDIDAMFDALTNAQAPQYGQRTIRHHNTH